jgi:hypothetical protein
MLATPFGVRAGVLERCPRAWRGTTSLAGEVTPWGPPGAHVFAQGAQFAGSVTQFASMCVSCDSES